MSGHLKTHARKMRREPTEAERKLWYALRDRRLAGLKFRRQVPLGNYIADFVCSEARLIVEADGGQHNDNTYDQHRDARLEAMGFRVLRFWNCDVLNNLEGVLSEITRAADMTAGRAVRSGCRNEGPE